MHGATAGGHGGSAQLDHGVFQGERCQPFFMIPLERWNVERKVTSAVKVQRGKGDSPLVRSPIGWLAATTLAACQTVWNVSYSWTQPLAGTGTYRWTHLEAVTHT